MAEENPDIELEERNDDGEYYGETADCQRHDG